MFLGLALGLASALLGGLLTLPGCYDLPTPACGFRCGPAGECPADYTCNSFDGRCHLNGSDPNLVCATPEPDAGPPDTEPPVDVMDASDATDANDASDASDAPLDADDGGVDAPLDADDGGVDAPLDADDGGLDASDAGSDATLDAR